LASDLAMGQVSLALFCFLSDCRRINLRFLVARLKLA
jgi:hypothetical protein